jgi:hypothetical protein
MFFTGLGHRRLAGSVLLSLLLPFVVKDSTAQVVRQVITPFGYRDADKVHSVPKGYDIIRMPDEHIRMQNRTTGDHVDFPKPATMNTGRLPFTDTGWVTFASWYNTYRSPIAYFNTDWNVPYPPKTYHGQLIFQFNGIEPASGEAILQPVLQYGESAAGGGEYWAVASWYVTGDQAYFTPLVEVQKNQFLAGQITLIAKTRSYCTYTCDFYGISGTTMTVYNIPELVWCAESLEVYNLSECAEFPPQAYSVMYTIDITLRNGEPPSMGWTVTNVQTNCGAQTAVLDNGAVNGTIVIYY